MKNTLNVGKIRFARSASTDQEFYVAQGPKRTKKYGFYIELVNVDGDWECSCIVEDVRTGDVPAEVNVTGVDPEDAVYKMHELMETKTAALIDNLYSNIDELHSVEVAFTP